MIFRTGGLLIRPYFLNALLRFNIQFFVSTFILISFLQNFFDKKSLIFSDLLMRDRNRNEVRHPGDRPERTVVTHGSGVYDVTSFADIHPGGRSYFDRFNKKVTQK